jgi:hypothetical protein
MKEKRSLAFFSMYPASLRQSGEAPLLAQQNGHIFTSVLHITVCLNGNYDGKMAPDTSVREGLAITLPITPRGNTVSALDKWNDISAWLFMEYYDDSTYRTRS